MNPRKNACSKELITRVHITRSRTRVCLCTRAHPFVCQLKITSRCFRVLFQSNNLICMASDEPLFVYTWNDIRVSTHLNLFAPNTNSEWQTTTRYLHPTSITNEKEFVILTQYEWRMPYYLFYIIFIYSVKLI